MNDLNAKQNQTIKEWANDRRLWETAETTEFNLRTFARAILRDEPRKEDYVNPADRDSGGA